MDKRAASMSRVIVTKPARRQSQRADDREDHADCHECSIEVEAAAQLLAHDVIDLVSQHSNLENHRKEEERYERKAASLGKVVIADVLEGLRGGDEQPKDE